MKYGSDEGVGEVASGYWRSVACVGMGGKETGDGREKAVCKMGDRCGESGGMLSTGWLLPSTFIDAPRDEK